MPAIPDSLADADALDDFDLMSSKRSSGTFGVALTSTPSHDERQRLPSQQDFRQFHRRSINADTYDHLTGAADGSAMNGGRNSVAAEDYLAAKRVGDRSSMRSVNGNANGGGGTPVYDDAGRRRSQYYENANGNSLGNGSSKTARNSPVVAELKTNVIIKDEFTLVTDLSHHLAQRYTRPDSAVMIRIDHSACLALGGTFEPCYILNLQTVPSQMGPSTNKRNASLIQSFLGDILSVPAERGIVTFTPIAEENLAMGGKTMLAEMENPSKKTPAPTTTTTTTNGGGASAKNGMSGAEAQRKNAYRKSMSEARSSSYLTASGNNTGDSNNASQDTTPTPSLRSDSASQSNDGRPSTAHGSAVNGLRMNGVSTENLVGKNARTPNGRPKTFGGTSTSSNSIQDQIKSSNEPLPHVSRQSTSSSLATLKANGQRSSKVDIKKIGAPTGMQKNTLQGPGSSHVVPKLSLTPAISSHSSASVPTTSTVSSAPRGAEPRPKNTYLDNVSTLTKKTEAQPPTRKPDDGGEDDVDDGRGEANMGRRRRSTMTATPKLPSGPPPIPDDSKETKSTRSLKLGKRKSFLRGFIRRSTQA